MFSEYDNGKNGYLSKGEMAQFIKVVFQQKQVTSPTANKYEEGKDEIQIAAQAVKNKTFEEYLGRFYNKIFEGQQVDHAWQMLDTENKGMILKNQSKPFLKSIEQCARIPNAKVFGNK